MKIDLQKLSVDEFRILIRHCYLSEINPLGKEACRQRDITNIINEAKNTSYQDNSSIISDTVQKSK